ncbi:MAG: hypothetical protein NVS9B15_00380 [Acidobacteriaceae bacterium]
MPDQKVDADLSKGAVEGQSPANDNDVSLAGQLPHRHNDALQGADTDFPEPGAREEHTGETRKQTITPGANSSPQQTPKKG